MKSLNRKFILVMVVVGLLLHNLSWAQTVIRQGVFGNGCTVVVNAGYQMFGTIGQTMIGVTHDASNTNLVGFWYQAEDYITPVEQNPEILPEEFRLEQNYPNPFNPETMIRYQLPKDGEVILIIYNMMGQEVRSLVDEKKKAGYYEVIWNGRDRYGNLQGTGMYLVRMQAGSFTHTRKLLLLK